jgi:acyl transferase domain-containing protein
MACRFPGARDVDEFWELIRDGRSGIARFGYEPPGPAAELYVPASGVVADIDAFDSAFFGIPPRQADVMDPQQRLLLECCHEALESGGRDTSAAGDVVGLFAGAARSDYAKLLEGRPDIVAAVGERAVSIATDKDHLTTSVAYRLDLRGPAVTVQSTCSTSLVAVHMACQSLILGECDLAVAGGVSLRVPQEVGYTAQDGVTSADGVCRPFDAAAGGSIPSGGVGVVVLRPLAAALADGDPVRAVLIGTAINNSGAGRVGYTAPSVDGQTTVIGEALDVADVDVESIAYVEGHGTATPLGDPIEVAALTQAFGRRTRRTRFCALGSVKANIGHADCAAGIAGLIKAVLVVERGVIPPHPTFTEPNPAIDLEGSPFYVNTEPCKWPTTAAPRRAGVSSFGIGGTNSHVILEEAPEAAPAAEAAEWQILPVSARTEAARERMLTDLRALLDRPGVDLADASYTLRVGRRTFASRAVLLARAGGSGAALRGARDREEICGTTADVQPPVAFLLAGAGVQREGHSRELYRWEPRYREVVDECCELLSERTGAGLRDILVRDTGSEPGPAILDPRLAVPAAFITELATASLWTSWGVAPEALLGYSTGEYVAACLAGVLTPSTALELLAARGELLTALPPGGMLSVALSQSEAAAWTTSSTVVAAINAPSSVVLSGPSSEIEHINAKLDEAGIPARPVHVPHAYHSPAVDPVLPEFRALVATAAFSSPRMPYVSSVTGTWATADLVTDPEYWVRHMREPVRFADGLSCLLQDAERIVLQPGFGQDLATLARMSPASVTGGPIISAKPSPADGPPGLRALFGAAAHLWVRGARLDWAAFGGQSARRRVAVPTHPFERTRHWLGDPPEARGESTGPSLFESLNAQLDEMGRQLTTISGRF